MANTIWKFGTASGIQFGRGSRERLAAELVALKVRRPILITDASLMMIPLVAELVQQLMSSSVLAVFDGSAAEPSVAVAENAALAAAEHGADCIIGLGGGSNLDVAKVTAVLQAHGGKPRDYFGFDRVPGPVTPLIALPTTAGTGSEVSHSAVLTDTENAIKVSILSRWLRPSTAIVDPALTDSCPAKVTADSGMDALVHAIEAYSNRNFAEMEGVSGEAKAYEGSYPLTRILAGEAIELGGKFLQRAVEAPDNQLARDQMSQAAMLAGMAFSNSGVGIVHALEYPIGALTHCGHGEGNGLLLPHVMRFNLQHCESEYAEIARRLGADVDLPDGELAEQAIERIETLQRAIGIPTRLRDLGLEESQIDEVASKAIEIRRLMELNRREPSKEDLAAILRAAF